MDPGKTFKFLVDYAVDWSRVTFMTIVKPISRFELVTVGADETVRVIGNIKSERQLWLNPKLLGYSFLSIILGLTINALIPNKSQGPDLLASVIIIFIYWFAACSVLHLFCIILRGTGKYLETLSVGIQVSSTLYVVISFLTFVIASLLVIPNTSEFVKQIPMIGELLTKEPAYVFFVIGTLLSMVYVPLSMKSVHKFGWIRTIMVAVIPPLTVWLPVIVYMQSGLLMTSFIFMFV